MLKHSVKYLLTLFLAVVGGLITQASADYRFLHLTSVEGLPHQQINNIKQDNIGRLWIGTRNGLSRYDGYEIVSYFSDEGDATSLPNSSVGYIFQDSHGRVWISTEGGVCRYIPESDNFKRYNTSAKLISSIVEMNDGRIVCAGVELYVYDEKTDTFTQIKRSDSEFIISLAVDNQNRLFVATNKSIFCYDSQFSKTSQINPEYFADFLTGFDGIVPMKFDSKGFLWVGRNGKGVMRLNLTTGENVVLDVLIISDGTVRVITEDADHRMWLGTEGGVTIINPDGSVDILRQNYLDRTNLNDNAIYSILCDRDDNIWIGTYFGGVNYMLHKNEIFQWIQPGYGSRNVSGKAVRQMIELGNNKLLIATEDGGINAMDTSTGVVEKWNNIPNTGSNIHTLFRESGTPNLWVGTFRNGLFKYNLSTKACVHYKSGTGHHISSDAIFDIKQQRNGRLWVATTQGLCYFDDATEEFIKVKHDVLQLFFVYSLCIDTDDNVWVGTHSHGLFRIDARTGEITGFAAENLCDRYITAIYQDHSGKIWAGTNTHGLVYIEPSGMKAYSFALDTSLQRSTIGNIIEDENDNLWVTTSSGLYCLNKSRTEVVRYTVDDGLPTNQFNYSSALAASDGRIYMGTINGLVSFDPAAVRTRHGQFIVHFKKLVINDKVQTVLSEDSPLTDEIDKMDCIELSNDQSRSFSIEYAAISLGNANSVLYQTRLLGYNSNWSESTQERKFVGSNLPAGTYTLQVRANVSNVGWEKAPVKEIRIVIRPPFYKTIYAYIIYALLLMVIIYYSLRISNMRLKEKNEVRLATMEKEKIEEVNKIKLDFFTSVSHELKTPLSLIISPLKRIDRHRADLLEGDAEMLDTAIKNSEKILELVDELVTFNKVETGTFKFYLQHGNPMDFVESLTHLFKESATEKNIDLTVYCENNGEEVWFSPSYVERIMNNLLSNALKFTPNGGKVAVKASIESEAAGSTYLHLEVKDSGIGIAKEELQNIFNPYYQTKRGHTKNHKGWGIGLSLVKKLAEIHKGSVSVESEIGHGSKFIVDLNVDENAFDASLRINQDKTVVQLKQYEFSIPRLANAKAANDVSAADIKTKSSVLLVEDNTELIEFLAGIFSADYNVFTAGDGKQALECVKNNHIDLVISDVMMPVMDGIELCRKLKQSIDTSHIPVILLTAKNDVKDVVEGYASGADAYVQKPFDPQILELQVNNILKKRAKLRERIVSTPDASKIEETSQLTDFDKEFINRINELIDGNMENEHFSVADITNYLGISRSLLHVKMKSLLNISTADYVRKRRLARACVLLREGFNVSETSYRTGFSEPNYFSKAFKKEFGVSPTEWLGSEEHTEKE